MTADAQLHDSLARGGYGVVRVEPRLRHNFIDGALSAAPVIATLAGQPIMVQAAACPLERALHEAEQSIAAECGAEPAQWAARAQGRGPRQWGSGPLRASAERHHKWMQTQRAQRDVRDAAWVASCGGLGAQWLRGAAVLGAAFVDPLPGADVDGPSSTRLETEAFALADEASTALVHWRLGIPGVGRQGACRRKSTDPRAKQERCPCADVTPHHLVTCPFGPWVTVRHDRIARLLQLLCLEIPGASVQWTPETERWPQQGGGSGKPDLCVSVPGWRPVYVDVAVVFPHSTTPGRAATDEERVKRVKYTVWRDQSRVTNVDFYPLVFESFGRLGRSGAQLTRRLATRAALDRGLSAAAECARWLELLAVCLQLSQAAVLLEG